MYSEEVTCIMQVTRNFTSLLDFVHVGSFLYI